MARDQMISRWKRRGGKTNGQLECSKLENEEQLSKNRQLVQDFVSTRYFKVFIITTIFFNAVLIAMISPDYAPVWLSVLLDICTVMFFSEMVLKMYATRLKYFDDPWNLLDFATVLGSITELIVFFLRMAINAQYEARPNLTMTYFRLVRLLRLLAPRAALHAPAPAGCWRVARALLACGRRVAPLLLMAGFLYALMAVYALNNSWAGLLTQRCADNATGDINTSELCYDHSSNHDDHDHGGNSGSCAAWRLDTSAHQCAAGFSCVETHENPNLGGTSFDNFLMAYLTIFQITTLGGWKDVLWAAQATLNWAQYWDVFLPVIILGGFVAVNTVTAAVVTEFNNCMAVEERRFQEDNKKKNRRASGNIRASIERALDQAQQVAPSPAPQTRPLAQLGRKLHQESQALLSLERHLSKWEVLAETNQIPTAIKDGHMARPKSNRDYIKSQWKSHHDSIVGNSSSLRRIEIERLEKLVKLKVNEYIDMAPDAVVRVFTLAWNGVGSDTLKLSCTAQDSAFNLTMNGLIVVNIVCMACGGYNISKSTESTLTSIEYMMLCIFTYEMGLKLLILGIHGYFSRHENIFDASVVLISWPLVGISNDNGNGFMIMYRICARLLKIFRIGELYMRYPAIQRILEIGGGSIQNMIPVCLLLLLYTFVLAVVGVQIFGSRLTGDSTEIEEESWMRYSFKSFLWSWVTIYYVIVGENWQAVLYIAMDKVSKWAALFFVFVVVTGSYVGLNLLTAVVLDCVSANHAAVRLGMRLAVCCNHAMRRIFLRRAFDRLLAVAAGNTLSLPTGGSHTFLNQGSPKSSSVSLPSNQSDQSPCCHSATCLCLDNNLIKFNLLRKYNRRHLNGTLSIIHGTMNRAPKFYALPFDFINTFIDDKKEVQGPRLQVKRSFTSKQLINRTRQVTETVSSLYSKNCQACGRIIVKYQKLCVFLSHNEKAKKVLQGIVICFIILLWCAMFVDRTALLWWVEMGITNFFIAEVLWKSTANGFFQGSNSYVKNKWNLLDLFIVLVSFAELLCYRLIVQTEVEAEDGDLSLWVVKFYSVLLVAKSLRPLRLVVLLEPVQRTVGALLLSIRSLGALAAMVVSAWAIYAIVGMQLFKGLFYSCSHADFPENVPLTSCVNASFDGLASVQVERSALHFDNFFASMGVVFAQATLIGWQPVLFDAMDATSIGNSPKIYNNPEAFMYFFVGTFVFGILVVNLLMGAIFDSFIQIKDKVSGKDFGLDVEQKRLRSYEEHLMALRPIVSDVQAKSEFRCLVQKIVNSKWFKYKLVSLMLLIQTLILCATHAHQSEEFSHFQTISSHCIAVLFLVEAILKLYGHGVKPYFSLKGNIFDFVISLIGLLDLVLFPTGCGTDVNFLTRLRTFRIFRLIPLLSHKQQLHFLTTLMQPLPAVLSVLFLMSYVAFFYANLGVQLYSGVTLQPDQSTAYIFTDFNDLRHGFEMMTILATGDSWTDFLIEFIDQSQNVNYNITFIFFGSYFVIQVWILVNMLIMFIVVNFELMNSEDIQRQEIIIKGFKKAWAKYDPEGTGWIRRAELPALVVDVPAPLGVACDDPYLTLAQTVDRIECQSCFSKHSHMMEIQDSLGFNNVLVSMCAIAFHPLETVANECPADMQLLFQKSVAEQKIRTFLKRYLAKYRDQLDGAPSEGSGFWQEDKGNCVGSSALNGGSIAPSAQQMMMTNTPDEGTPNLVAAPIG